MPIVKQKSIVDVFDIIKKKTGHKPTLPLQTYYHFGWLVYYAKCQYCKIQLEFFTETSTILINKLLFGDFLMARIRLNPQWKKELLICKRLRVML